MYMIIYIDVVSIHVSVDQLVVCYLVWDGILPASSIQPSGSEMIGKHGMRGYVTPPPSPI